MFQYCMVEHFYNSELSVLCCHEKDLDRVIQSLNEEQLEKLRRLPSFRTYVESKSKKTQVELITDNKFFQVRCINYIVAVTDYIHGYKCFV